MLGEGSPVRGLFSAGLRDRHRQALGTHPTPARRILSRLPGQFLAHPVTSRCVCATPNQPSPPPRDQLPLRQCFENRPGLWSPGALIWRPSRLRWASPLRQAPTPLAGTLQRIWREKKRKSKAGMQRSIIRHSQSAVMRSQRQPPAQCHDSITAVSSRAGATVRGVAIRLRRSAMAGAHRPSR